MNSGVIYLTRARLNWAIELRPKENPGQRIESPPGRVNIRVSHRLLFWLADIRCRIHDL